MKGEIYHIAIRVKQIKAYFMTLDVETIWKEYNKICIINKHTKEKFDYVLSLSNEERAELVKEGHVYFRGIYGVNSPYIET